MLTEKEKELILHALGLTPVKGKMRRWASRNFFVADDGGHCDRAWKSLTERGFAVSMKYSLAAISTRYTVATEGIEAAGVSNRVASWMKGKALLCRG